MKVSRSVSLFGLFYMFLLAVTPTVGNCQSVIDQYNKGIKPNLAIKSLGPDLFGEDVSLLDGSTSFHYTDISLPANHKLPISLGRTFDLQDQAIDQQGNGTYKDDAAFGIMWEMDVPYLKMTTDSRDGWVGGDRSKLRCSHGQSIPYVAGIRPFHEVYYDSEDFYGGILANIPGYGSELLLNPPRDGGAVMPSDGYAYYKTSRSGWRARCTPVNRGAEGYEGGEGFSVLLPDGSTYRFDWLVSRPTANIIDSSCQNIGVAFPTTQSMSYWNGQSTNACTTGIVVPRREYFLYATEARDRFGNTVRYNYDVNNPRRLLSISSSDGSSISITYKSSGQIDTASANGRTWRYIYDSSGFSPRLRQVILPDGSAWGYEYSSDFKSSNSADANVAWALCRLNIGSKTTTQSPEAGDVSWLKVTHPSGAQGEFKFRKIFHGTKQTENLCVVERSGVYNGATYTRINGPPSAYQIASLYEKSISGLGLGSRKFVYSYNPGWSSPYVAETMVAISSGEVEKFQFGTDRYYNYGLLLQQSVGTQSGPLKTTAYTYLTSPDGQNYPFDYGFDYSSSYFAWNGPSNNRVRVLLEKKILQDGASFTWRIGENCLRSGAYCYDARARPLRATVSSTLGTSVTETTSYYDNDSTWVLGQIAKRSCIMSTPSDSACTSSSASIAETNYHPTTALPTQEMSFGKLQRSYTWTTAAGSQAGTLRTVTDGSGNVTTYGSWKRGVPQAIRSPVTPESPAGALQAAVVNDDGTLASVDDETDARSCYAYDAMGRLSQVTHPAATGTGTCNTSGWNPTTSDFSVQGGKYGLPNHWRRLVTTGNGYAITRYDALWRPIIEETYDNADPDATRSLVVKRYDAAGRLEFQSYSMHTLSDWTATSLKGVHTTYDALDRPLTVKQDSELGVLTTTNEYLSGFITRTTDPRGNRTVTGYQAWDTPSYDLPVVVHRDDSDAVRLTTTRIERDAFGKPLSITRQSPAGSLSSTRSYVYDEFQQLCKTVEPETGANIQAFDGAGNVAWSVSGSSATTTASCSYTAVPETVRTTRSYDARNRVKTLAFPAGSGDQSWTYTPDGLPASVSVSNPQIVGPTVTTYAYDRRRNLVEEVLDHGQGTSGAWDIDYAYNRNGHLSTLSYPSGFAVDYAPNALGQPTQAGSYATNVSYFPNGAIQQFTYGNGFVHTLTQNTRQLPERSRDALGAIVRLDDSYDYDENGNVAAISDGLAGNRGDRTMTYDALDRLTATTSPMYVGGTLYTYDQLDNLKRVKTPGRDYTYVYDANWRLTNITNTSGGASVVGLGYDNRGNLSNKNGQLYDFDYGNRLREVPGIERYAYDGLGRRTTSCSTGSGACAYHLYSRDGQLLFTSDGRNDKRVEQVYLGGSLVAQRERPLNSETMTVKYQHTDALGTPVVVTGPNGGVFERWEYEPYGRQLVPTALSDGPGYAGHVSDAATGLSYMQQRYYDPGIGRFLSVDPIAADGNTGGKFNRYAYALNNPYLFTDPDGRDEFIFTWKPGVDAVGHSAIGVQNRNAQGQPNGTVTVRHLWPAEGVGKSRIAGADYRTEVIKQSEISKFQGGEGKGADGIVRIAGGAKQDAAVLVALAKADNNSTYSAKAPMNTCSTFSAAGVSATGIGITQTGTVSTSVAGFPISESGVVTPLAVYNSVVNSGDPRVSVERTIPQKDRSPNLEIK